MLVRKNRKVAMKSKRRWRRYWGEYIVAVAVVERIYFVTNCHSCSLSISLSLSLSPISPASLKGCSLIFSVCEDDSAVVPDDMPVDTKLGEHLQCISWCKIRNVTIRSFQST